MAFVANLVNGEIYFSETFDDDWHERWVQSTEIKASQNPRLFEFDKGTTNARNNDDDLGLYTPFVDSKKSPVGSYRDMTYAASAHFEPFSNKGKTLIIQYEVKIEVSDNGCYSPAIRLGPPMKDPEKFDQYTPYHIRFGPDYCSTIESKLKQRLTALEFAVDDRPIEKSVPLKFYQDQYNGHGNMAGVTHLYRLTIKPDNTVRVDVDMKKRYKGPLHVGWDMIEEPRLILDPSDSKPDDWVDAEPMKVGTKPAWWVDEEMIPVPGAQQPPDWDEDEDGEWGPPLQKNPAYEGEWVAQEVRNPRWKGEWKQKQMINPEWQKDNELYIYEDIGYVAFLFEDRRGGTLIDNIIVTDKKNEADAFAEKWKNIRRFEDRMIRSKEMDPDDMDLDIFQQDEL